MIQTGTPIKYRKTSGQIFPGFVSSNNGVEGDYMIYFDTTQSGATNILKGPVSLPDRDDTLSTFPSYAVVSIEASAKFTGA